MTGAARLMADQSTSRMYSVTELAHELGVTPRTLRFYEDKGLLKPQRVGGTRVYLTRDRARLILILRGKRLGFSLREISEYLDLYDADPTHRAQIDRLLHLVQDRILLLEQQREALEETLVELREIEQLALEAIVPQGGSGQAPQTTTDSPEQEHAQPAASGGLTGEEASTVRPLRRKDET